MWISTSIFLWTLVLACCGIQLPDYFLRCSLSDPHFGQCISDAANIVIPKLAHGNKDFNFPPVNILAVPDIVSSPCETTIKLKLVNVTAGKLEDARSVYGTFDIPGKTCNMTLYFPRLRVTGNYELDANTDEFTARGNGEADITFTDVYIDIFWIFSILIRDGNRHLNVLDSPVKYKIKGAKYTFTGLFDGDETLGKEASDQINNNWRVLEKLISPTVMDSIERIIFHFSRGITEYVSLNDVFRHEL